MADELNSVSNLLSPADLSSTFESDQIHQAVEERVHRHLVNSDQAKRDISGLSR